MSAIEYKGYRVAVSAQASALADADDDNSNAWSGRYRIWMPGERKPVEGTIDGSERLQDEAAIRTLRIVKVAIDEAMCCPAELARGRLTSLGDRFTL